VLYSYHPKSRYFRLMIFLNHPENKHVAANVMLCKQPALKILLCRKSLKSPPNAGFWQNTIISRAYSASLCLFELFCG